ncbi:MAG: response regulator [Desulfobacterales bacterium]|nr:response regulator [Desulfobacterales bacterium]
MGKKRKKLYKILSIDNDIGTLDFIQDKLTEAGYEVFSCSSVERAISALEFSTIDIIIAENNMPVIKSIDLLRYVKENFNNIEMMITGLSDIYGAVNAIKGMLKITLLNLFQKVNYCQQFFV